MLKRSFTLLLALLCLALTAVSCTKKTDDTRELIGLMPTYIGEPVTSTYHEFTKDEFTVLVSYADGTDETITDYDFEVLELRDGYFFIEFTYGGLANKCYIPCEVVVYPSDAQ